MHFNSYQEQEEFKKIELELKNKRELQEDSLSFDEFLKSQLNAIEYIEFNKTNDLAYKELSYIIDRINTRLKREPEQKLLYSAWTELHHLNLTEKILERYEGSSQNKKNIINDAKKNLISDVKYMIQARTS